MKVQRGTQAQTSSLSSYLLDVYSTQGIVLGAGYGDKGNKAPALTEFINNHVACCKVP